MDIDGCVVVGAQEEVNSDDRSRPDWTSLSADALHKIAGFLPMPSLARMSITCRACVSPCADENTWRILCNTHVPAFQFRNVRECSALGGWKALYKKRFAFIRRHPLVEPHCLLPNTSEEASTSLAIELEGGVRCLDACGAMLVAGCSTGEVVIYNTDTLPLSETSRHPNEPSHPSVRPVCTFHDHEHWVYSVCCMSNYTHADGSVSCLVASCSRDQTARVYAGPRKAVGHAFAGPTAYPTELAGVALSAMTTTAAAAETSMLEEDRDKWREVRMYVYVY